MNKIIKELVGDATLYADSHWDRGCAPWHQFYNEKFAELLILECAKIADEGCGSACFGLGINGAMLKEHFGVEE